MAAFKQVVEEDERIPCGGTPKVMWVLPESVLPYSMEYHSCRWFTDVNSDGAMLADQPFAGQVESGRAVPRLSAASQCVNERLIRCQDKIPSTAHSRFPTSVGICPISRRRLLETVGHPPPAYKTRSSSKFPGNPR